MAMQWFRSTQITGKAGQVVDLIRYKDGARVGRFIVPPEGAVTVEYGEVLGECYVILHDDVTSSSPQAWQPNTAVARGAVRLSSAFPGYALTCAIAGTTGAVAPGPAQVKRNWVHRLDLQGANGDLRFGKLKLNGAPYFVGYGSYPLLPTAEDGQPGNWPIVDLLQVVGTFRHLVALKADGTLMVKSWAGTSVPAFYSAAKALTGVVYLEASYDVLHCHLNNGTVVHLADSGSVVTYLGNSPVLPGWAGTAQTYGISLSGGVLTCRNAAQQAAVSGLTGVVCGMTNANNLIGVLLSTGYMRLIDPADTSRNIVINPASYGEFVEFGARDDALWVITSTGWRFALTKNPKSVTSGANGYAVADWVSSFQGLPLDQLSLLACPFLSGSRLLVATPGTLTTVFRNSYTSAPVTGGVNWIPPQSRLVVDGSALFYAAPISAALIHPLWVRNEHDGEVTEPGGGTGPVITGDPAYLDGVVEEVHPLLGTLRPLASAEVIAFERRGSEYVAMGSTYSNVAGEFRVETEVYGGGDIFAFAADFPGAVWQAGAYLELGDRVRPSVNNGFVYEVISAGNTGATEPAWWADAGDGTEGSIGSATAKARPYYQPVGHGPLKMTLVE